MKHETKKEIIKYTICLIMSILATCYIFGVAYRAPDEAEERRRQTEKVKNDEYKCLRAIGGR